MNDAAPDTQHIDIRYVADLARIQLKEDECERLQGDLDRILGYIEQLNSLNLEGLEPMTHPRPRQNVLRADEIQACMDPDEVIENAPASHAGLIRVPPMMEG